MDSVSFAWLFSIWIGYLCSNLRLPPGYLGLCGSRQFDYMVVKDSGRRFMTIGFGGGDLSPGNDIIHGGGNNDQMFGWGGDDELLLRWDQDTANGGDGADTFILDGRYVDDGDAHVIEDLNFADGDTLVFRYMDAGTFDNDVDLANNLAVANAGATATFDSVEDILEAHANGVMTAADDGFGGTVLSLTTGGDSFTVTLDGLDII